MKRACILLFLLLSTGSVCHGQWKQLFQFSDAVRTIYFLDQLGHSETGFAGLNDGELWQTFDSGKTWTKIFTDPERVSISDLTFKSLTQGWFVTKPLAGQSPKSSLYMTTDGGLTWNIELQESGGSFASIYYHEPQKVLFLSEWQRGGLSSLDDGNSWNRYTAEPVPNGYAFSDPTNGVVSFALGSQSSVCNTVDGGLIWQLLTISPSACWQPAAKIGSSTYFMFSEYTITLTRSDDNGASWIPKRSLPIPPGGKFGQSVTGCLRISPCDQFFIQSTSEGFYSSSDDGMNWQVIGGPSNEADTRFWVSGNDVYGGDFQGGVWVFPSIPPSISISPQINIFPSGKQLAIQPGKDVIAFFSVSDTIRDLDSLTFDLHMGSTFLNLDSTNTPLGWKIMVQKTQPGLWNCRFYNESHTDIIAANALAFFYFSSYLTTDTIAGVSIKGGSLFFNPKRKSGCSVIAMANTGSMVMDDSVTIISADTCGDKPLRHFLTTGNIDIQIISIRPNPASNEITIETESSSIQEVNAIIYNDLGREYLNEKRSLQGKMTLTFPITSLSAGAYHLMLKSSSGSVSSEFVKLH